MEMCRRIQRFPPAHTRGNSEFSDRLVLAAWRRGGFPPWLHNRSSRQWSVSTAKRGGVETVRSAFLCRVFYLDEKLRDGFKGRFAVQPAPLARSLPSFRVVRPWRWESPEGLEQRLHAFYAKREKSSRSQPVHKICCIVRPMHLFDAACVKPCRRVGLCLRMPKSATFSAPKKLRVPDRRGSHCEEGRAAVSGRDASSVAVNKKEQRVAHSLALLIPLGFRPHLGFGCRLRCQWKK